MEIISCSKSGRYPRTEDVAVSISKSNSGKSSVVVISLTTEARNKLYSERIVFGVEDDRIYFLETDATENGFKLKKQTNRDYWVVVGATKLAEVFKDYKGRQNFQYDSEKKSYYIERKEG